MTFTVTEVNDAPVRHRRRADDAGRGQPRPTTSTCCGNDYKGPANESGQTLTVTAVTQRGSRHGGDHQRRRRPQLHPDANFNGPDSFTYTVTDNGTTNGAADPKSDTATVTSR